SAPPTSRSVITIETGTGPPGQGPRGAVASRRARGSKRSLPLRFLPGPEGFQLPAEPLILLLDLAEGGVLLADLGVLAADRRLPPEAGFLLFLERLEAVLEPMAGRRVVEPEHPVVDLEVQAQDLAGETSG